jgi:hypothetical protein
MQRLWNNMKRAGFVPALAAALALTFATGAARAATVTIVNIDGPGEGFNDLTAAAPVGGNSGTTVGQQRLNVFDHAGAIWGALLPSTVTIRIEAAFDPLTCTATSAVLGQAGALAFFANFSGAPVANTAYPDALANKLHGSDLDPAGNDIQAQFNASLNGNVACLNGVGWYYGFDGNEGTNIDLLPVVLHEIGHGLGFASTASVTSGVFQTGGLPGMYDRKILDKTQSKHWDQLTAAQRIASAINTGNVVWDGQNTTLASPLVLGPRSVVVVNSPAGIAGTYSANGASFGQPLSSIGLTGVVVLADDGSAPNSDACSPLVNGAQVSGKIAFIDRGTCTFASKAAKAQAAGAIGVIMANNVAGAFSPGGADPTVTIPVVGISLADGNTIRAQLGAGVNATLKLDLTQNAGTDAQGRVLLFTPNPVQPGSSISHWDTSAFPNLLMEPAINPDLRAGNVDLTEFAFRDIGWFQGATDAGNAPVATRIIGNAPNPFNPLTKIRFELATTGPVRLTVYDLSGRLVKRIVNGSLTAGVHALPWDGTDGRGRGVAAGVYLARLEADGRSFTHRMVLVK